MIKKFLITIDNREIKVLTVLFVGLIAIYCNYTCFLVSICSDLLVMCSDIDATTLACIAFSCPNLEVLEISTSGSAINRISG